MQPRLLGNDRQAQAGAAVRAEGREALEHAVEQLVRDAGPVVVHHHAPAAVHLLDLHAHARAAVAAGVLQEVVEHEPETGAGARERDAASGRLGVLDLQLGVAGVRKESTAASASPARSTPA